MVNENYHYREKTIRKNNQRSKYLLLLHGISFELGFEVISTKWLIKSLLAPKKLLKFSRNIWFLWREELITSPDLCLSWKMIMKWWLMFRILTNFASFLYDKPIANITFTTFMTDWCYCKLVKWKTCSRTDWSGYVECGTEPGKVCNI